MAFIAKFRLVTILLVLGLDWMSVRAVAGTATNIAGLYYTGQKTGGTGLATQGGLDGNWSVTYATDNGGSSTNSAEQGTAYVVSSSYLSGQGYVANTSQAQWITAPGASTSSSGGNLNQGGDNLPGNGTSGSNEGIYVYTLAFTISGTGTGTVTNSVAISLTIAADDSYYVFVNPQVVGFTASASAQSAWGNTTAITLANYTNTSQGISNNATFVIGTNYLDVEVVNSNSISGSSSSTALNPSGLLVYQVGNVAIIDGRPVPEMATWLPVAFAMALGLGLLWWRRSNPPLPRGLT